MDTYAKTGFDNDFVAHDNRSRESGVASPADIILVDGTHSASAVHHDDVCLDRESSCPTMASSTHILFTSFQSFHMSAPSISDGYELYNSALSPSLSLSRSHSPSSSPSLHNHRSYHSLLAFDDVNRDFTASESVAPIITPARYTNNLRRLSHTKPSRPLPGPMVQYSSPRPTRGQAYRVFV